METPCIVVSLETKPCDCLIATLVLDEEKIRIRKLDYDSDKEVDIWVDRCFDTADELCIEIYIADNVKPMLSRQFKFDHNIPQ